jgi:hypothetical protein
MRRLEEEGVRVHLVLFKRDIERIDKFFAQGTPGTVQIKRSEAIRKIITKFLDQVDARTQQLAVPLNLGMDPDT